MANKRITYYLLLVFLLSGILTSLEAQQKTDSLIINVGTSKVIFLVNDPNDLEELSKYDLNAILNNLKLKLAPDSTLVNENEQVIGDTTIVVKEEPKEESEYSEEYEQWKSRKDDDWRRDDRWRSRDDDRRTFTINTRKRRRDSRHLINFDLGTNNYLNDGKFPEESDAQHAVRPWGSWYFAINSTHQFKLKGRLYLELGPGISWYNFKFQDDRTRITEVDGVTTFIEDPDINRDYKKSKLTASFLNIAAVPMIQFGRERKRRSVGNWDGLTDWNRFKIGGSDGGFRMGVGGYAGYRLGSHSKVKFEGGKKDKDRDNFNLTNLRYGVRVQMGYRGTDLFFNYDMNELFNEGKGPKLNAFSFGIIL